LLAFIAVFCTKLITNKCTNEDSTVAQPTLSNDEKIVNRNNDYTVSVCLTIFVQLDMF
jgi:hypothetical protein